MAKRVPLEQRRRQFVEAAAKVIADEGVEKATTRRIAEEVGAPLATLHYCFHSKDELLDAVRSYLSEGFVERLAPLPKTAIGLEAAIEAHAQRLWEHIAAHPEEQVATFELLLRRYRHASEGDRSGTAAGDEMYRAWVDSTSGIYAKAARAAGEPVPTNLRQISQLFIAGIDGLTMMHVSSPHLTSVRELLRILVDSLIRSCTYEETEALT